MRNILPQVIFWSLCSLSVSDFAGAQTIINADPTNWCSKINGASAGSTVILAAGNYADTCAISASGAAGSPITIQSKSSATVDRAVFTYTGSAANFMDVYGSYLTFRWLTFSPAADNGANPIKPRNGASFLTIDQNVFQGTDIIVPANDSGVTYQNIVITNNIVKNCQSTGIYLGCHDGSCHVMNSVVQGNLIDTTAPGDGVGYGMEIKLNSSVLIRDNTVLNAAGPGIMVYGSNRGDPPSIVEGNYVEGNRSDAGINVGGGPAIVRNNVIVNANFFGIWAQDYNSRGLQQNVWITNNTTLNNQNGGISVQNWQAGAGNVLAYNAITTLTGTPTLNPSSPAGAIVGNVPCNPATSCFDQPTTEPFDLWPVIGGPLIGAAGSGPEAWRVTDDFMGVSRGTAADVGAFQRVGTGSGPLVGGGAARPPRTSTSTPTSDTTPPSVPTGLTAVAISSTQIVANWSASTDNVGVAGYKVFRCQGAGCAPSAQVGTTAATSYLDNGLSPSTTYAYKISAFDMAGNVSALSSSVSAVTLSSSSISSNLPPVVSAIGTNATDVDPATPGLQIYDNTSVTYTGSASDPNGGTITWQWLYSTNGGAPVLTANGTGTVQPFTFNYPAGIAPKTYVWILSASNGVSTAQQTLTVNVIVRPSNPPLPPADPTPGLKNVSVYPNPAVKRDPTIRAFLGQVNSVEVTIFDVSGHVVNSGSLSGAPTGILNGQYYYDYKWTGANVSGAYFAVIHGKAADGTIVRARTKFVVVR